MPFKDIKKLKAYRAKYNKSWCRKYRIKRRLKVLTHYSNGKLFCFCCKETTIEFLSVNHINGGGTQQRKLAGTRDLYALLIRLGLPEGYNILCHNCNQAIGFYGKCPHVV